MGIARKPRKRAFIYSDTAERRYLCDSRPLQFLGQYLLGQRVSVFVLVRDGETGHVAAVAKRGILALASIAVELYDVVRASTELIPDAASEFFLCPSVSFATLSMA